MVILKIKYISLIVALFVCACGPEPYNPEEYSECNGKSDHGIWFSIKGDPSTTYFMIVPGGYIVKSIYLNKSVSIVFVPSSVPESWISNGEKK